MPLASMVLPGLLWLQGFQLASPNSSPGVHEAIFAEEEVREIPTVVGPAITEICFTNTSISGIPKGAFRNIQGLTKVEFLQNQTETVEVGAFDHLTELEQLEISSSPTLRALPLGCLRHLGKLRKLNLKNNNIEHVSAGLFSDLGSLEELFLNNDTIRVLPEGLFEGLHQLRFLHLGRNRLEALPGLTLRPLGLLHVLRLWDNQLRALPTGFLDGRGELPTGFLHDLWHLEKLSLEHNGLERLEAQAFFGPTQLRQFWLAFNQLCKLPEQLFTHLPHLGELDVSHNQLRELPAPTPGTGPHGLRRLLLSHNQLSLLPPVALLMSFPNLTQLDVGGNGIGIVHQAELAPLAHLRTFSLRANWLQSVPQDFFETLPWLTSVSLGNNPWHCDCCLHYLYLWLHSNPRKVETDRPVAPQTTCRG